MGYKTDIYNSGKGNIIVNDWDEVCIEKTDIKILHLQKVLKKEDTKSIVDVLCNNCFNEYSEDDVIMFNPMGMVIFYIALAKHYVDKAVELNFTVDI